MHSPYTYYGTTLGGLGGLGSLDDNDYALRRGWGVSTKMITYYMSFSALLIFKVFSEKFSLNELHVTHNT